MFGYAEAAIAAGIEKDPVTFEAFSYLGDDCHQGKIYFSWGK